MSYTSPSFLFLFLPAIILLYSVTQNHLKKYALLIINIAFYALFNIKRPIALVFLVCFMFFTYLAGKGIRISGSRFLLAFFVSIEVFAFFSYRIISPSAPEHGYFVLSGTSLLLLSSVSYLCDVYRKDADPNLSFVDMATYISFFPIVAAGPIIKYKDFLYLLENRNFCVENVSSGIVKFCSGFIKKVVIASTLCEALGVILPMYPSNVTFGSFLCVSLIFFFGVMFELWGYVDMASGAALILGYRMRDNFKNPASSCGTLDFFGRFYIGLKDWIREYVYIPLAKNDDRINFAAIFVSCIFGALWFKTDLITLAAGVIFAFCICAEKKLSFEKPAKKRSALRAFAVALTFVFVSIMFFVMSAGSLADITERILPIGSAPDGSNLYLIYTSLFDLKFIFAAAFVLVIFVQPILERAIRLVSGTKAHNIYRLVSNLLVLVLFVFSILYFLPQSSGSSSVFFDLIPF